MPKRPCRRHKRQCNRLAALIDDERKTNCETKAADAASAAEATADAATDTFANAATSAAEAASAAFAIPS